MQNDLKSEYHEKMQNDLKQISDLKQELGTNFIEYAVAVNTDRAIPDATSGLKPVAKRILWSAFEEGRLYSKPHVKSARIVGDVMGKYHPHGDSSIYLAMVRLSQGWVLRYVLIDWHGSNGNQLGDGPAASRYTEARLSKLAEDGMLKGIKKKNVDFIPNYDETEEEPVTLPAIFPNLLCNPNTGIGVAMACNWLPHNLREVAQAIFDFLDGKEPMLPGPDFPTGGVVINKNDIPTIMKTGHGSVKVRGKYNIEKNNIVFYEIPYGKTVEDILSQIGEVCDKKEIEGISEIRDESNKKGIRLVVECNKTENPHAIVMKLFNKTDLQTSISYNQVALVDKTPTELNLKQAIEIYVEHNKKCIVREAMFDIEKTQNRLHIIIGLIKALDIIDEIITMIKASPSAAVAKETLQTKWRFTEVQAKAILDMKLSRLAKLEKEELEQEKKELEALLIVLKEICEHPEVELKKRLSELVKKYGDDRRTELTQIDIKPEEKEIAEVVPTNVVVVTTKSGLIKKIPTASFRIQKRGGKGIKSDDEAVISTIKTNTVDYMMFFTDKGKMYRTIVDNIPDGTNTTKGVPINSLVQLESDERVIAVTSLHRQKLPKYAIFVTRQGMFKKSNLSEYMTTKRNAGIAAIKIKEGDSVANVIFQDDEDMIILTKKGMSIKFATKEIGTIGRLTTGIKGINLAEDDEVLTALPIHKDTDTVAVFTAGGFGKKVKLEDFPMQNRGGKGTSVSKEELIGAAMISDEDNILVIGNKNSICFSAKDIPLLSRAGQGNILIKNNRVLSVTKF